MPNEESSRPAVTRVDLDYFAGRIYGYDARLAGQTELRALVAELRAAREVVEAADFFWGLHAYDHDDKASDKLARALSAYEKVMAQ